LSSLETAAVTLSAALSEVTESLFTLKTSAKAISRSSVMLNYCLSPLMTFSSP